MNPSGTSKSAAHTADVFDADAVRAAFETSFMDYFGQGPREGYFDQPAAFWLDRRPDGEYVETRVRDAWTGWLAASRRYAYIESMARVAHLGHEQWFARCQELELAARTAPDQPTKDRA